jgi:hypothetical protein
MGDYCSEPGCSALAIVYIGTGRSATEERFMMATEPGSVLEMYSSQENGWVRVVVTQVDDDEVKLRYEGVLEFITVPIAEIQNNPERFKPAADQG